MSLKLLLVEDQEDMADLIVAHLLQDHPRLDITVLGTMKEALDAVSSKSFDLLILDMGLPDGGGLSIVTAVRKGRGRTKSDAPTAIYSGLDPQKIAHVAEARGADAYFPKGAPGMLNLREWVTNSVKELRMNQLRSRAKANYGSP